MKELEEQQRLEKERRQKEEEELYRDVEKLAKVIIISCSDSSTNKTDHHDITKILFKVALNTITLTLL